MRFDPGAQKAFGLPVLLRADRIRYDEAAKHLREHYATTGSRSHVESETRLAHLDKFFVGYRLVNIDGALATRYVPARQAEGAANDTINRELGVLVKMLRLASEHNKLLRLPKIRKLRGASARGIGFFEPEQYEAVRRRLPEDPKWR